MGERQPKVHKHRTIEMRMSNLNRAFCARQKEGEGQQTSGCEEVDDEAVNQSLIALEVGAVSVYLALALHFNGHKNVERTFFGARISLRRSTLTMESVSRSWLIFGKHCALENLFASTIRLDYRIVCYWNLIRRFAFNRSMEIGTLVAT